jgi:putative transposase
MRANGLRPVWRRKFVPTTHSKHTLPLSPNLLVRQFEKPWPNLTWVCDITYIRTRSGWQYLAAVMDLHARKIVGWAMAPEMPATLVCTALKMAIVHHNPTATLVGSMGRKGNWWDNAVMERFFLDLKRARVWLKD